MNYDMIFGNLATTSVILYLAVYTACMLKDSADFLFYNQSHFLVVPLIATCVQPIAPITDGNLAILGTSCITYC